MDEWAPDIPLAVRSELPPYGIKPHWVTFRFSTPANRLYDLYNAHVDRGRGNLIVWPTLDELAKMMGLSRGDKVTPYMRELESGGAVEVETVTKTGGKGRRYIVTLKVHPPAGYTGPLQTSDWYEVHRTDNPGKATMADRARGVHPEEPAGDEVPPLKGVYPPPADGGDVPPLEGGVSSNQSNQNKNRAAVADAVGQSASGFACAGTGDSAAGESTEADGGCAASEPKSVPQQRKQSPRPATTKTRPRQESPGWTAVRNALPAAVAAPGTKLYPGLHRAINDLLTGAEGIPRRSPEQVIARVNRRWYGENAEERSSAGYRGCDRCTPAGCTAPRRSHDNPDGCDRIRNRNSWLTAAILAQDCPDPGCEDGQIIGAGACPVCRNRAEDHRAADRTAAELKARLEAETDELRAARAAADEWEDRRAAEDRTIRARLMQAGVYGVKLDYQVGRHMAGWRERHPQPAAPGTPPSRQPAPF